MLKVTDEHDNVISTEGKIASFIVKSAVKHGKAAEIRGLDRSWTDKKVLCILLEQDFELTMKNITNMTQDGI